MYRSHFGSRSIPGSPWTPFVPTVRGDKRVRASAVAKRAFVGSAVGGRSVGDPPYVSVVPLSSMGWSFGGQWRREWTCVACNCKGNNYNRVKCKRCFTPWWGEVQKDPKKETPSKWANGMPGWLKSKPAKETPKEDAKEPQIKQKISSIQSCLEVLGEEEKEARDSLTKKLEELKAQEPEEPEDSVRAKEVSELKKKQHALEQALAPLKGVEGCEEAVGHLETSLQNIKASIKEKTQKPAEERMKSLHDKKTHKIKAIKALDTEIEDAEKALKELKKKEEDLSKEVRALTSEMMLVMKELSLEEEDAPMEEDPPPEPNGDGRDKMNPPNGGVVEQPKLPKDTNVSEADLNKQVLREAGPPQVLAPGDHDKLKEGEVPDGGKSTQPKNSRAAPY